MMSLPSGKSLHLLADAGMLEQQSLLNVSTRIRACGAIGLEHLADVVLRTTRLDFARRAVPT